MPELKINERKNNIIVFTANSSWYIYNFKLSLINLLISKGFKIFVISPIDEYTNKLKYHKIKHLKWDSKSDSINLISEIKSIINLYKIYKEINPNLVHHFTIKCVLYGTIICKFLKIKNIFNSITGLGNLFLRHRLKYKILFYLIFPFYKLILQNSKSTFIFQNNADKEYFEKLNIVKSEKSILIRGSGVDTEFFNNPKNNFTFPKDKFWKLLFPGRIIKEKGIDELLMACDSLWHKNLNFKLYIAGKLVLPKNKKNAQKIINKINSLPYLEEISFMENMKKIYKKIDIVVLPSWREGLSKALLEAASMGLPIITTDVPGCRDVVIHGITGLLVKKKDPIAIENAIELLTKNPELCEKLASNARAYVIQNFKDKLINDITYNAYLKSLTL